MQAFVKIRLRLLTLILFLLFSPLVHADGAQTASEEVLLEQARQARLSLKPTLALKIYNDAIAKFSKSARLYAGRADLYHHDLGEEQLALADLNKAWALEPKTLYIKKRAKVLETMGKSDLALLDYNKAILLEPKDQGMLRARGRLYKRAKKYSEAASDFETAAELMGSNEKDTADIKWQSGELRLLAGDSQKALKTFNELIKTYPSLSFGYWGRSKVYALTGLKKESKQDEDKAKELDKALDPALD